MFKSDLFPDPNPLAEKSSTSHPVMKMVTPPPVSQGNPLSVAQYNGFVDGAVRGSKAGFFVGAAVAAFIAVLVAKRDLFT